MVTGAIASALIGHYVEALAMRRKAHQMGAVLGGRMPCTPTFVPGGSTEAITDTQVADAAALLAEISTFIDEKLVPDTLAVASVFPQYYQIGAGCRNLLAYGVFDLDDTGSAKLMARGRYTNGGYAGVDPAQIKEYINYSYYSSPERSEPRLGSDRTGRRKDPALFFPEQA